MNDHQYHHELLFQNTKIELDDHVNVFQDQNTKYLLAIQPIRLGFIILPFQTINESVVPVDILLLQKAIVFHGSWLFDHIEFIPVRYEFPDQSVNDQYDMIFPPLLISIILDHRIVQSDVNKNLFIIISYLLKLDTIKAAEAEARRNIHTKIGNAVFLKKFIVKLLIYKTNLYINIQPNLYLAMKEQNIFLH